MEKKNINLFVVHTTSNRSFLVNAETSDKAIEMVEQERGLEVSDWNVVHIPHNDCVEIENLML